MPPTAECWANGVASILHAGLLIKSIKRRLLNIQQLG